MRLPKLSVLLIGFLEASFEHWSHSRRWFAVLLVEEFFLFSPMFPDLFMAPFALRALFFMLFEECLNILAGILKVWSDSRR